MAWKEGRKKAFNWKERREIKDLIGKKDVKKQLDWKEGREKRIELEKRTGKRIGLDRRR